MILKHLPVALPWRPMVNALALSLLLTGSAMASLVSPVTVRLIAPGGIVGNATPISETASVDPATGLLAGDAGNLISSVWMLPGESITFTGNSILLHLLAGAGDTQAGIPFTTGYLGLGGDPARYEFAGLQVAGSIITGYSLSQSAGLLSGINVSLASASQLNFNLDQLVFDTAQNLRDANGYYFADVKIDLITQPAIDPEPLPEPASWALALVALAALRLVPRRAAV